VNYSWEKEQFKVINNSRNTTLILVNKLLFISEIETILKRIGVSAWIYGTYKYVKQYITQIPIKWLHSRYKIIMDTKDHMKNQCHDENIYIDVISMQDVDSDSGSDRSDISSLTPDVDSSTHCTSSTTNRRRHSRLTSGSRSSNARNRIALMEKRDVEKKEAEKATKGLKLFIAA